MKKLLGVLVVMLIVIGAEAQSFSRTYNPLLEHGPLHFKKIPKGVKMKQDPSRSGVSIPAPVINFTGNQVLRTQRSLHNTTDSTISFYFSHLFKNDQEFIDYLRGFITNPTDTAQSQRELMSALFDVTKYYFSNNTLIFDWQGDTAVFEKEMSFIGFLYSMHNVQCGNFFRHATTILIATQYFTIDDFETINVPGHSIGQIKNMQKPIFADFDAGMGFSWNKNPHSPNGYADIDEIRQDTLLINEYYARNGEVLIDTMKDNNRRTTYRGLLTGNPLYRQSFYGYVPPLQLTSEIVLPAHTDVVTTMDNLMLAFDVSDSTSLQRINNLIVTLQPIYQAGGCSWCMDSFLTVLAEEFRVDRQLLNVPAFSFVMYNSDTDQGKPFGEVFDYEYQRETPPVWNVSGSNVDTIVLGTALKMPFLLLNTQGISGLSLIGDTLFTSPAVFHLWDAGDTAPLVTSPEVNYIQSGFIPPSPGWNLTVAVNAHIGMLSPLESWQVDIQSGQGLTFETIVEQLSSPTVSVHDIAQDQQSVTFFPNPARETIVVHLPKSSSMVWVYNVIGERVTQFYEGNNNIASLVPGVYFIQGKKLIIL
ncbi:MAG: hypothetical protein WCG20_00425 [bacterium]